MEDDADSKVNQTECQDNLTRVQYSDTMSGKSGGTNRSAALIKLPLCNIFL